MSRPSKLEDTRVSSWLSDHPGWKRTDAPAASGSVLGPQSIAKAYTFPDFASALAFAVRVGCIAERMDHHPDLELGWGRARVTWSTHDAGGLTQLDLQAAEATDSAAG
jgi:4a-hydroxytetrahydrobiopterin dehydratase